MSKKYKNQSTNNIIRGFTLIELLAVIVILAIIALIAVPIVVNIINDSKEESIKRSAEIYLDTVEKRIVKENLKRKFNPNYCEGESGEELVCYDENNTSLGKIDIEIKNKVPKNIILYFNNGKLIKDETLKLELEGYMVSADIKGEVVLQKTTEEDKECVLYEDVLNGEKLTQSEYVDYTGYTEYTGGMTFKDLWQQQGIILLTSIFDSNTKKWTIENRDDDSLYMAYYIIQEDGYYQLTIENGEMNYEMNIQDEELTQGSNNISTVKNGSSEIAHLEAGQKIIILASPGSSFYITKSNKIKKECKEWIYKISETEDYIGYYADVDGDGTVDGVIYADLAQSSEAGAQYYNSYGTYSYTAKTNLNEYTISQNKHSGNFGEKEIIKLKKDKGNPRFYVMALEDFRTGSFEAGSGYTEGTYFWYKNAYGKMNVLDTSTDFGTGYANTGKIIEIWNKNGVGAGSYSGATKDDHDIFKHIQEKYNSKEKWYIPSRGEWGAFADYFTNKTDLETKLTTSNYNSNYGLSDYYWSSSQVTTINGYSTFSVYFNNGGMGYGGVSRNYYVRLGATF